MKALNYHRGDGSDRSKTLFRFNLEPFAGIASSKMELQSCRQINH
jgi:hypothetical protein